MEEFFPEHLMNLLLIGSVLGIVVMTIIQKLKQLLLINKKWHIFILNICLSMGLCIPFSKCFYNLNLLSGIWVGIFAFAGSSTIFDVLKNQKIISLKMKSLNEKKSDQIDNNTI